MTLLGLSADRPRPHGGGDRFGQPPPPQALRTAPGHTAAAAVAHCGSGDHIDRIMISAPKYIVP